MSDTDNLLGRLRACVTLASAYKLMDEAAGEIERLMAALRDADGALAILGKRVADAEALLRICPFDAGGPMTLEQARWVRAVRAALGETHER